MATINTPSASPDREAAELINHALDEGAQKGALSPQELDRKIRADAADISHETRTKVHAYLNGMQTATKGASVEKLENGVGGLYNGQERKIAQSTLEVNGDIQKTVSRMQEVGRHEMYHEMHKHLEPMKTAATEEENDVLQLGGESFKTDDEAIEGLTVHDTGHEFVSDGYRDHESDLVGAASRAGVSMEEVRRAINDEKDLTIIDDRTREQNGVDVPVPMAV